MPRRVESCQIISWMLTGGDRRSIGRSNEVAALVLRRPQHFQELIECLRSPDPVIRMRAADVAEKASAQKPGLLKPFKAELLKLLAEAEQQELRWHLAVMVPRLRLSSAQQRHVLLCLRRYLSDRSSIVRTCAMQGLADLVRHDARIQPEVVNLIEDLTRTGTPRHEGAGAQASPTTAGVRLVTFWLSAFRAARATPPYG